MFIRISELENRLLSALPKSFFLEGDCSDWGMGEGSFLYEGLEHSIFLVVFDQSGHFQSYEFEETSYIKDALAG